MNHHQINFVTRVLSDCVMYLFSDQGEHCGLVHLTQWDIVLGQRCKVWGLTAGHLCCLADGYLTLWNMSRTHSVLSPRSEKTIQDPHIS